MRRSDEGAHSHCVDSAPGKAENHRLGPGERVRLHRRLGLHVERHGDGTTVFSPSVSGSVTVSVSVSVSTSPSDGTSSTPTPTPTSTITPTPSPSVTPSPTPTVTYYSPYPTAAPVTGGGGTAGFQDAGLAVLGGGAILAGAGSIIYRRHTTRKR